VLSKDWWEVSIPLLRLCAFDRRFVRRTQIHDAALLKRRSSTPRLRHQGRESQAIADCDRAGQLIQPSVTVIGKSDRYLRRRSRNVEDGLPNRNATSIVPWESFAVWIMTP